MPQRYLVTGGAGFIGSHLSDALLARGDEVVALDNLATGRLVNLDRAMSSDRFRFVQGSVLDELAVDELVRSCDVVVHLAAAVGVKLIVEQRLRSLTTNIRGSENLIEAAHRYRRKILLASSSEIYGKNPACPLSETADRVLGSPTVARWAYSTAKAGLIHLTRLIAVEYGKFGIRANAVAPGTVRTQAWEARAAANRVQTRLVINGIDRGGPTCPAATKSRGEISWLPKQTVALLSPIFWRTR